MQRTPLHAAWVAYQYKVLPFRLSLAPRTFTRCMDAAFSPLRQMRICILNTLTTGSFWPSVRGVSTLVQDLPNQPLRLPGAQGKFITKIILSPSQRVSFLGTVYRLSADDSNCLSGASHDDSTPSASFKEDTARPFKSFPEKAGPYGSVFAGTVLDEA